MVLQKKYLLVIVVAIVAVIIVGISLIVFMTVRDCGHDYGPVVGGTTTPPNGPISGPISGPLTARAVRSNPLMINASTAVNDSKAVAIIACHGNTAAKQSANIKNLFYIAEVATNIVIVDSLPSGSDFLAYFESRRDVRGFFEVVDRLGALPRKQGSLAQIVVLKTENTDYLCHHKWLVGLDFLSQGGRGFTGRGFTGRGFTGRGFTGRGFTGRGFIDYTDYILTNDSVLFVQSLKPWAATFHPEVEATAFLASNQIAYHFTDFLRRYSPKGVVTIRDFYEANIDLDTPITYGALVKKFEIGSTSLFQNNATVFHKAGACQNIHFTAPCVQQWLDGGYEVVKIKFLARGGFHLPHYLRRLMTVDANGEIDSIGRQTVLSHNHRINARVRNER